MATTTLITIFIIYCKLCGGMMSVLVRFRLLDSWFWCFFFILLLFLLHSFWRIDHCPKNSDNRIDKEEESEIQEKIIIIIIIENNERKQSGQNVYDFHNISLLEAFILFPNAVRRACLRMHNAFEPWHTVQVITTMAYGRDLTVNMIIYLHTHTHTRINFIWLRQIFHMIVIIIIYNSICPDLCYGYISSYFSRTSIHLIFIQ